jgi:hypothetical protein
MAIHRRDRREAAREPPISFMRTPREAGAQWTPGSGIVSLTLPDNVVNTDLEIDRK